MEHHVWLTMLGIMGLLTLAVLMVPVANRLNFPFTVMLAAAGILIGFAAHLAEGAHLGVVSDLVEALHTIEITSEAVFFVFLPALVFESALSIDVRRLLDDIAPILMLAVLGLLISTVAVGTALWGVTDFALIACLLLGAIVSATDPVAVVAIFKDLGAPKRLAILVEGESLFNDATAIVVFTILSAMLLGESDAGALSGILSFLKVFFGGILVGYVLARIACFIVGFLGEAGLPKITLTVALAYLAFIIAEHYLHLSGVMAVVTAALVIGSRGRSVIPQSTWHGLEEVWEQIGFAANSVIFVLVGVAVPTLLADFGAQEFTWLTVLIVTAFVARFAIIFGLVPVLIRLGWAEHVATGYRAVMFWGGLRGAVSLALALAVMENTAFAPDVRQFIGVLVTGFVLFTLAINATTVHLVMRMFGLDKLSAVDAAIRDRVLGGAMSSIGAQVRDAARRQDLDSTVADRIAQPYEDGTLCDTSSAPAIGAEDWKKVGLRTLTLRENQTYHRYFDQGLVSPEVARNLFRFSNDLLDGIKVDGIEGYERAWKRGLMFNWQVKLAAQIQRRLGWSGPLARHLARRFESLQAITMALRRIQSEKAAGELVEDDVREALGELLSERLQDTQAALDALRAAYPDYADKLEHTLMHQVAARLEQAHYKEMLAASVIGKEVYKDLTQNLKMRESQVERPRLDLGLDPANLVGKVPFFADLPMERKEEIARMLKPRLAFPGETIVAKGEKGDAMYFISSGAVKVALEPQPVILGSGDFFGEMALLSDQPRVVDVVAEGFCDLLGLYTRDFRILMERDAELKATIEEVAAQRAE
ncbi:MAG: cation:proton antiporter [Xanthomonadales bacterium]|nr:cation:proton antiporter [Xanthomonadales bacterium]